MIALSAVRAQQVVPIPLVEWHLGSQQRLRAGGVRAEDAVGHDASFNCQLHDSFPLLSRQQALPAAWLWGLLAFWVGAPAAPGYNISLRRLTVFNTAIKFCDCY